MKDYKRLTNEELNDFLSRVFVQLEPKLAQQMMAVANELLHYRNKIENGTLVELPCKIGDTFWYISIVGYIEEDKIADISLRDGVCLGERLVTKIYLRDLGKSWFLTKPEAEAKLRELKGERE